MKKVCTYLYSKYELQTRKKLFRELTGAAAVLCTELSECMQFEAVFLNFEHNRFSASEVFSEFKKQNVHCIVYSDRKLHPIIVQELMQYEKCSLIICPEEFELESIRRAYEKGERYLTMEAERNRGMPIPCAENGYMNISGMQQTALYYILCGVSYKQIALETGTTEQSVAIMMRRLRKLFGDCPSNEKMIEHLINSY